MPDIVKLSAFINQLEKDKQPIGKLGQGYKEVLTKHTSLVCFVPWTFFPSRNLDCSGLWKQQCWAYDNDGHCDLFWGRCTVFFILLSRFFFLHITQEFPVSDQTFLLLDNITKRTFYTRPHFHPKECILY